MKRLLVAAVAVACLAAAFSAWSVAAPTRSAGKATADAVAPKLPALPPDVKSRKRFVVGVKCDTPPFGYIDVQGRNGGYDVEIARRFADLAFGKSNRVNLVCVNTASRIPTLTSNRVDMIIATVTWTQARADQIDFSIPYYSATGRLMVPNGTDVSSLRDLAGKTVVTTRGSVYATWLRNCFKNTNLLEVDGTAPAVLAVKNQQADMFMYDDAFILGVATQDRDLKLTSQRFLALPWGIGMRKGDTAMKRWVDAALKVMQRGDEFQAILKANTPKKYVASFLGNVPRPNTNFQYPVGRDATSECPTL
jgi:polar amino acid transport system substrate-binding protein